MTIMGAKRQPGTSRNVCYRKWKLGRQAKVGEWQLLAPASSEPIIPLPANLGRETNDRNLSCRAQKRTDGKPPEPVSGLGRWYQSSVSVIPFSSHQSRRAFFV